MRLGIDFDNTIACYDGVFYRAALEKGLIPADLGQDKTSVRDHLVASGQEDLWTELQGHVYGARMDLVTIYDGFGDFLEAAQKVGHRALIVSHKTRYPYRGERHDLHQAAQDFLEQHDLIGAGERQISSDSVYFKESLDAKLETINALDCGVFIDDLQQVFEHPRFPGETVKVLFDPQERYVASSNRGRALERCSDWRSVNAVISRMSDA